MGLPAGRACYGLVNHPWPASYLLSWGMSPAAGARLRWSAGADYRPAASLYAPSPRGSHPVHVAPWPYDRACQCARGRVGMATAVAKGHQGGKLGGERNFFLSRPEGRLRGATGELFPLGEPERERGRWEHGGSPPPPAEVDQTGHGGSFGAAVRGGEMASREVQPLAAVARRVGGSSWSGSGGFVFAATDVRGRRFEI